MAENVAFGHDSWHLPSGWNHSYLQSFAEAISTPCFLRGFSIKWQKQFTKKHRWLNLAFSKKCRENE